MSRYLGNLARYLFFSAAIAISSCGGSDNKSQPNRPPEIGDLPSVQINENELYTLDIPVSDPDGDTVYLSKKGPSGISFSGKQLRWTPRDDQVGSYNVTVGASDGKGGYVEKGFDIEVVDDLSDNPIVDAIPDTKKTEGKDFSYQTVAKDPDTGQTLTLRYGLGSQTDQVAIGGGLTIDPNTGLLEWNNLPLGRYKIEIEAEDVTGRKGSKSFDLTVVEPRYILSGRVVDVDGNPIPNVSVSLKGRSTGATVTDQNGEYEIRSLLRGDYDITIEDSLNIVYDRSTELKISSDLNQDLLDIRMRQVASNDTDYLDGTGLSDFLAMLKDSVDMSRMWNSVVVVYPNVSGNSNSAESKVPGLDINNNGKHDYLDILEEAMVFLEAETGVDFEVSPTPVGWDDTTLTQYGKGIHFNFPDTPSGGGDSSSSLGPYSEIQIRNDLDPVRFRQMVFRELMFVLGMKHTKGDPYILIDEQGPYGSLSKTVTEPHVDEIEVLNIMYKLPNGIDEFDGR